MKDNKYQELMSHISMTPEMEKRVMEAMMEEIEEQEAIMEEETMAGEAADINPGPPPVVLSENREDRTQPERKTVKKKFTKKSRAYLFGSLAAAACLILVLGLGLGAALGSRRSPAPSQYADNAEKQNLETSGEDSEYESNDQYAGSTEVYDADYDEDYEAEEVGDEDPGYVSAKTSSSADNGVSGSSENADQAGKADNKDNKSKDQSGLTGDESEKNEKDPAEKLVYTCTVTVETESYRSSIEDIRESIKKCNGFIESEYEYGDASGYDYSSENYEAKDTRIKHNKLVIRIPMDRYESFVNGMSAFGNVTEKNQDVVNITKTYQDTETRIKALKTQENRLLEMMKKAETISDMITVEDRLTDVQSELEYYQNDLNTMDNKVNYGTVELSLHQVKRFTESPEVSFSQKIKNRFEDGINAVAGFFRGLALMIVFLAPILLLITVIVIIVIWVIRRNKKKKAVPPRD